MPLYWLWYSLLPDISLGQKLKLLEHFRDPEEIYLTEDYSGIGQLSPEQCKSLRNKDLSSAQKMLKSCAAQHIGILTYSDAGYPRRLRNIDEAPLVLFYKGILPDFETRPVIGVVGTRKASAYGLVQARQLSQQITACGGLVVSGGAAGIDTLALQGAMEAGGQTVAVLGCGVDVVYPKTNKHLFQQIERNGCLLSEYLPGTEPKPWQFPQRNRIISGVSNGVLVVEAPEKSGALITAGEAARQGRDVFVVPCNIDVPTGVGSNALLQECGTAVFSGWDVLKEYAAQYPESVEKRQPELRVVHNAAEPAKTKQTERIFALPDKKGVDNPVASPYSVLDEKEIRLTPEERQVLACLCGIPCPVDEVLAQLDMPSAQVLGILTRLSLKGMVKNHPGRLVSV